MQSYFEPHLYAKIQPHNVALIFDTAVNYPANGTIIYKPPEHPFLAQMRCVMNTKLKEGKVLPNVDGLGN